MCLCVSWPISTRSRTSDGLTLSIVLLGLNNSVEVSGDACSLCFCLFLVIFCTVRFCGVVGGFFTCEKGPRSLIESGRQLHSFIIPSYFNTLSAYCRFSSVLVLLLY